MDSTAKEKADILLQIIGVGPQLAELEIKEKRLYDQRHAIGVIADQKEKFAKEQIYYPDAPKELISIADLIAEQQEVLAKNGENARKRQNAQQIKTAYEGKLAEVNRLSEQLKAAQAELETLENDLQIATDLTIDLIDESTEEIESNIANIEQINLKVRANLDKEKAEEEARVQREEYNRLSGEIEAVRKDKRDLLINADLPLEGLSVNDGKLLYLGQEWDNMSGSQQLMVATAIVRKLKPDCGFVLIDKLEQMDQITLDQFGRWLEDEGLQAIATRVSTGDECEIIIEDGYSIDNKTHQPTVEAQSEAPITPSWQGGF